MPNEFSIKNDSGTRNLDVATAEILFVPDDDSWLIGIHISGFDADSEYVPLHLIDYRIDGIADPRQSDSIKINLLEGADGTGDNITNLCVGEHTATDDNRIRISREPDGRFRVEWSGVAEDFEDRFFVDVIATEVSSILYP